MLRRPPRSTCTDTLVAVTTVLRSQFPEAPGGRRAQGQVPGGGQEDRTARLARRRLFRGGHPGRDGAVPRGDPDDRRRRSYGTLVDERSEEHTSELQSLMRISYAVFCLKKNKKKQRHH